MAYHGILVPSAIAATNVDSFNRSAVAYAALDNGNVVKLTTKDTTEVEAFTSVVPSSGNGLTDLWMVYSGDEVVLTDSRYKGLDPDPRNFFTASGDVVSVYKPQLGDIILMTTDALSGSYSVGSTTHINATNGGGKQLVWGTSQTASVLSYKLLLPVKYISLGTGAIDDQRVAAYEFECVGL